MGIFSRKAWLYPINTKSLSDTTPAIEKFFSTSFYITLSKLHIFSLFLFLTELRFNKYYFEPPLHRAQLHTRARRARSHICSMDSISTQALRCLVLPVAVEKDPAGQGQQNTSAGPLAPDPHYSPT